MTVRLIHPTTGARYVCAEESVDAWLALGWEREDDDRPARTTNRRRRSAGARTNRK